MVDLATLAIAVDTRQTTKASTDLDHLTASARGTAQAVASIGASAQQAASSTAGLNTATGQLQANVTRFARAANDARNATGLARHELINLGRQAQDIGVSLVSGQSVFMVMAQQGAQVFDILSSSQNGVRGALSDLRSRLSNLVTPGRVAGLTIAGAGIAAYTAWSSFSDQQNEIAAQLGGLGQRSGATVGTINALGDAIARTSDVSRSAGRDLAALFAGAGLDSGNIAQAGGFTRRLSLQLGLDLTEAGQLLSKSLDSPSKGADELNKKLGFLDDRTREYIRSAEAMGRKGEAQKALMDAMQPSLSEAEKRVTALGKAWNFVWNMASGAATATGEAIDKIIRGPTSTEDFIEALRARRGATVIMRPPEQTPGLQPEEQPLPPLGGPTVDMGAMIRRRKMEEDAAAAGVSIKQQQNLDEEMLVMLELGQAHEQYANRMKKVAADIRAESLALGDIVREVIPELQRLKSLQERRTRLEEAAGDPKKMEALGVTTDQFSEALARLNIQEQVNRDAVLTRLQNGRLEVEQINARTLAERSELAQRRAALEVLRQNGGLLEAAAAAENERNKAMAEANRQLRDERRDLEKQVQLLGLKPLDRALKEIQIDAERRRQDMAPGRDLSVTLRSAHQDFMSKLGSNQTEFLNRLLQVLSGGKATPLSDATGAGSKALAFDPFALSNERGAGALAPQVASAVVSLRNIVEVGNYFKAKGYAVVGHPAFVPPRPGAHSLIGGHYSSDAIDVTLAPGSQDWNNPEMRARILKDLEPLRGLGYKILFGDAPSAPGVTPFPGHNDHVHIRQFRGISGGMGRGAVAGQQPMSVTVTPGAGAPVGAGDEAANQALKTKIAYDQIERIYRDAEDQIAALKRANEDSAGAWSRNAFEIDRAANEQRLLNQAYEVTKNVTPEVKARIAELSVEMAKQQQVAREQKQAFDIMRGAVQQVASGVANFATSFVNDILEGKKATDALQSALKGLASQLLNFAINMAINMAFKSMFPQFMGASALGNVFAAGRVVPFALGGLTTGPTFFPMANGGVGLMGERGTEAVMPLARDNQGRLGVRAQGNQRPQNSVNIYNLGGAQVETETQENDTGGVDFTVFVDRMTAQGVTGPDTRRALEGQYALPRRRRLR